MNKQIKKALVNVAPYGVIEKRRRKQREIEQEKKRLEQEQKRLEKERQKEQARLEKERIAQEKKQQKEEEKKQKFLATGSSPRWGRFYAEYHEKEDLEQNWIMYESYAGIGMICNPYAIFKAFMEMPEFTDYIHIWVIRDVEEIALLKEEYSAYSNVIFIQFQSKAYAYFLAKAKYLINNVGYMQLVSKKEGQIYLNTWHSITVKTLGYDIPDARRVNKNVIRNLLMTDYIISPNEFMTEIFEKSFRLENLYEGKYIQEGHPRNDLVIHTDRDKIIRKLEQRGTNVDRDKKVILYAPTWSGNDTANPVMDMKKYTDLYEYLMENIDKDKYQILIKPHQIVYKHLSAEEKESGRYVSYSIDTNELLSVVDILITDYSSIYFDFLLTDRPILFYIPDFKLYENMRGIYFKLEELPGPCAKDLASLAGQINHIETFEKDYKEIRSQTRAWACRYDDGKAAEKMIDIVFRGKEEEHTVFPAVKTGKKKIFMYVGGFQMNGVTSAALNLLNAIDYDKYDVSLFSPYLKGEIENRNFDEIPERVRVFLLCGNMTLTEEQKNIWSHMKRDGFGIAPEERPIMDYLLKREYMRCFGESQYDYIIDFSGYGVYFPCLTARQCPQAKKYIWQHNNLKEDFSNTEKRRLNDAVTTLEGLQSVYPYYDKIVSVNQLICEINREKLGTRETVDKFTYCRNLMDAERIEKLLQSAGSCQMDGGNYIRIITEIRDNGVMSATLIPFSHMEKECVKFVTMGRCMPEKNHRSIILAMKRLIEEGVPCCLYIIGDGHMREELEGLAKELGIEDRIVITGFISNPFAILKECDCFVFPSSYEAQPFAVLEARTVGLPIVVSNYPAVESVMLEDKQYIMKGMDEDAVYQGMRAYLDGKVPSDYHFDVEEYNNSAYQEFLELLGEKTA